MLKATGLPNPLVVVMYTNHRGEISIRKIRPLKLYWGSNEWHSEPQWLLEGYDKEKKAIRTFALKDMKPVHDKVRVFFKNGDYTDVLRGEVEVYESQQDWDKTEEILN